jgi:hypothetical protein
MGPASRAVDTAEIDAPSASFSNSGHVVPPCDCSADVNVAVQAEYGRPVESGEGPKQYPRCVGMPAGSGTFGGESNAERQKRVWFGPAQSAR